MSVLDAFFTFAASVAPTAPPDVKSLVVQLFAQFVELQLNSHLSLLV